MGKVSKSTKHFSKKHLGEEIKSRKRRQKVQFRDKKKWGSSKTPLELAQEKEEKEKKRSGTGARSSSVAHEDEEGDEASDGSTSEGEGGDKAGKDGYGGDVDSFLEKGFFDALGEDDDDDDDKEDDEAENSGGDEDEEEDDEDSEEAHKKDLEALRAKDPEFYKYLQENDQELLQFGEEDESGDEADDGEAKKKGKKDEVAEEGEADGEEAARGPKILTLQMIGEWSKALEKGNSFRSLREMVRAFESACHIDTVDDKRGKGMKKGSKGEDDSVRFKFRIVSGQVFERLMRSCIAKMHLYFAKYLGLAEAEGDAEPGSRKINPQSSPSWKKTSNLAKAYVKAVVSFADTLTDTVMVHMLLRHSERMLPYMKPFPKIARKLLKVSLRIFGAIEENRVQAFLVIRRLALEMPHPFIESCYKGMYLTYVRYCKFTNPNVQQGQLFMAQCVVELFGIDLNIAYEHAFVYIRQLAIQLRSALTCTQQKSKESHQAITCWQYINSLLLWARMMCAYPGTSQLHALVYPWVQVAMGVVRHVNAPKYYPLRLLLCGALTRVGYHAGVYVPLAPFYLDILSKKDLYKTSNRGGDQAIDFSTMVKVSKGVLASRMYQEQALEETLKGLLLFLGSCCYSPAFPEIIVQVVIQLRVFAKATQVNRFRRQVKDLIDKLDKTAAWVMRARNAKDCSPQMTAGLNCLKPAEGHMQSGLSPLHAVHLQSALQAGGDLKELLAARNKKSDAGAQAEAEDDSGESSDEEDEEQANKKTEPRWKEARREKKKLQKQLKKGKRKHADREGEEGGGDQDGEKEAPTKKAAKGKTAARAQKKGVAMDEYEQDRVEDFTLSSDED